MRKIPTAAIAAGAAGGALAYSVAEARWPRLQLHRLQVRTGIPPLRILHLSDTHLRSGTGRLAEWVATLPQRLPYEPDLVIGTGDFIEDDRGIHPFLRSLDGITARFGCFYVLGSHDYYQAEAANYLKYFVRRPEKISATPAATEDLEAGLKERGWRSLTNTGESIEAGGALIRLAGMDDPYLDRHDTSVLRRRREHDLAIAVVHCPDVVAEAVLAGFDLVLAGHTHGGQVRVPGLGALVTNSLLPAGLAAGPRRVGAAWLHVTPGLGTGKFAPIRFNCRPEATLLELAPAQSRPAPAE